MILNEIQQMHLRNVRIANDAWRKSKVEALTRAKAAAVREVAAYCHAMDVEVRLALAAGVPKTQIARGGLQTSAPASVVESLARTATEANTDATGNPTATQATPADPLAGRYGYAPVQPGAAPVLVVTLTPAELLEAAHAVQYEGPLDHDGIDRARYTLTPGATPDAPPTLTPLTENFIMELGERHPGAHWAARNLGEALVWVQSHPITKEAAA